MKIILAILCGLMALFGGGCAITLLGLGASESDFSFAPLILIPIGVALLNILALVALFATKTVRTWPLYVLAGIDGLVVAAVLLPTLLYATASDAMFGYITAGGFLLKGLLSFVLAQDIGKRGSADGTPT